MAGVWRTGYGLNLSPLDNQDGTLAKIASSMDLATCEDCFTNMEYATLPSLISLTNQLTICQFTIKDGDGENITPRFTEFTVSNGGRQYKVKPSSLNSIYVAMRPVTEGDIEFTATDGTYTYTKSVSGKRLDAATMYCIPLKLLPDPIETVPSIAGIQVYDGSEHALATAGVAPYGTIYYRYDYRSFKGEVSATDWSTDIPTGIEAGNYTVYYKVIPDDGFKVVEPTVVGVALIDQPDALETAPEFIREVLYDGSEHALVIPGAAPYGTLYYRYDYKSLTGDESGTDWSTDIPTGTERGHYTVYYKLDAVDGYKGREAISLGVTLLDYPEALETEPSPTGTTLIYNTEIQTLANPGYAPHGTIYYRYDYEPNEGNSWGTDWFTDTPAWSVAGRYTLYYKVVPHDGYRGREATCFGVKEIYKSHDRPGYLTTSWSAIYNPRTMYNHVITSATYHGTGTIIKWETTNFYPGKPPVFWVDFGSTANPTPFTSTGGWQVTIAPDNNYYMHTMWIWDTEYENPGFR